MTGVAVLWVLITLIESGEHTTVRRLLVQLTLIGLGNGICVPAVTGAVPSGARPHHVGAAAGILTTTQQFLGWPGWRRWERCSFQVLGTGPRTAGPATGLVRVGDYMSAFGWVAGIALVLVIVAGLTSLRLSTHGPGWSLAP